MDIHKLIAAVSPDVHCDQEVLKEVKKLVKTEGYLKAAEKAKPVKTTILYNYDEAKKAPLAEWGIKAPSAQYQLIYDSSTEGLEPVYFWILDFLKDAFQEVEKLTDNFASSVGSGHFGEMGIKKSKMQEESMKILGMINTVIKSMLGIIYDLKEFKMRLGHYEDLKSSNKNKKEAAFLSLKQLWLDNVDIKRGSTAIKQLALSGLNQPNFVTLIDGFMAADNLEDIKKMDLNERVRRVLLQRMGEFLRWIEESDKELTKRFNIEKNYLKSQVNTIKLYSRWVKPYLKAAKRLEESELDQTSLVSAFNTLVLELTLLAKDRYNPAEDVKLELLPDSFKKPGKRTYLPIVLVEFNFRGIPQKVGQHYAFGGKTNVKFTSYALNEEELKVLKEEIDKDDFGEVMKLIQGATDDSLKEIQKDIEDFLEESEGKKEKEKEQDVNPFTALFSFFKSEKKEEKKDLSKGIKPDSTRERVMRSQASIAAREKCFKVFDTYKKANAMPSYPDPHDPI